MSQKSVIFLLGGILLSLMSAPFTVAFPNAAIPLGPSPPSANFHRWAKRAQIVPPPHLLFGRQASTDALGLWALRAQNCPAGTKKCPKPKYQNSCCPESFFCGEFIFRRTCCRSKERCDQEAINFPACADPSWSLWIGDNEGFFCCEPGQKGMVSTKGGGGCVPQDMVLSLGQTATSKVPYGGGTAAPTSTGITASSSTGITTTSSSAGTDKSSPTPSPVSSGGVSGSKTSSPANGSSPTSASKPSGTTSMAKSERASGALVGIAIIGILGLVAIM